MQRLNCFRCTGILLISCLLFTGCATAGKQGAGGDPNPTQTQYRFQKDSYQYLNDEGRHGIRNANPNLSDVGQWSKIKPARSDAEKQMGAIARSVEGVKGAEVQIVGGHAAVKVTPEGNIPQRDYRKLEEKVLKKLTFVVPRYEIRVRVGMSKWNPLRYLPNGGK